MVKDVTEFLADTEMPRARVTLLPEHFSCLEYDDESQRVLYPLSKVLLLVSCTTIASYDDFDEIEAWWTHHLEFMRQFAPFHFSIPYDR
jgi:hypothetical protein